MPNTSQTELDSLLTDAAFMPLPGRSFLRVTGEDRTRWLNGMVTNSIQALAPGDGSYSFLLNAQGRIQGDCVIFRDPDTAAAELLLETATSQIAALQQMLDKFIIMDDVELMPIMDDQEALLLAGPHAATRLGSLSLPTPESLHMARADYSGQPVVILARHAPLVPAFELWANPETIAALRIALAAVATPVATEEAFEALRILSGTPLFGVDIRDRDLPQEPGQTHALHFAKGCYLGQEIVERIRSRGQVHRGFSGFQLSALPAALPAALTAEEKSVGEITSAVALPDGTVAALGYIRREALERALPLTLEGGTATPALLPIRTGNHPL